MKSTTTQLREITISYKAIEGLEKVGSIRNSLDAYTQLIKFYDTQTISCQEQFVIMYLNRANKPIGLIPLFKGGLTGTVVDVRLIMSIALKSLASSVIISHNHPSGNLEESEEDKRITRKLKEACSLMEMSLIDHIIVTPSGDYKSFADDGIL